MQEALKKVVSDAAEPIAKTVTLYIRSQKIELSGMWDWDMDSSAVYCSDVMFFPDKFEGTKGIVHPDDLSKLMAAVSLMEQRRISLLNFRIITTYGEVKTITGQRISIGNQNQALPEPLPGREPWQEALEQIARKKELDFLSLRKTLADFSEQLHGIGCWLLNKTLTQVWYSDNVFRLYGLAPQSINAHFNSFSSFIHRDDRQAVLNAFEKTYEEELPLHIEYRIVLPNGELKYIQQITKWMFSSKGEQICSGIIRDVTEERRQLDGILSAQSDIHLHRQVLKLFEQETSTAYWHIHLATKQASYSQAYYRIYGFKQTNLPVNNFFLHLVHADDRKKMEEAYERMYRDQVFPETEFRIIRTNGRLRYLKQTGKVFINANKEKIMIGVLQDITVQKEFEQKIHELNEAVAQNKILNELMETTAEASIITWLPDGTIKWSEGFCRMMSYKAGTEPSSKRLYESIHPDDIKTFKRIEAAIQKGEETEPAPVKFITRNGIKQTVVSFRRLRLAKEMIVAVLQDAGQRMEWQQQSLQNKLFAEMVADTVKEMIIFTNNDHVIINWSTRAEQKTGIAKEQALFQNLFDVLPELKKEDFLEQLKEASSGKEINAVRSESGYLKKPHDYWLHPLKNESGELLGMLHVVQDVTKQVEMQQQLNERLSFIESLLEASVDRIVALDRNMNYLYCNKKAEDYYGIAKEKLLGKNILEVFPAFRNHPNYSEFRKVLKGETIHQPATEKQDGYFETWLTPVKDDAGEVTAVLWIVHDLSKEFRLQQEQRKTYLILDAIETACCELDREGNMVYANRRAEEFLGMSKEKMLGKNVWELFPESKQGKCWTDIQLNALNKKQFAQSEYVSTVSKTWISLSATPTEKGCIVLFNEIQDIVEARTELQKEQETVKQMLNGSMAAIVIMESLRNEEGEIIDFVFKGGNKAAEKINLISTEELLGKGLLEMFSGVTDVFFDSYVQVVETGVPIRMERLYQHEHLDAWFDVSAVKNGDGFIMTFVDITEAKKIEEELKKNLTLLRYTEYLAQSGTWDYEVATGNFKWSEGMYRLFGLSQQKKVNPQIYLRHAIEQDRPIAEKIVALLQIKHDPFEEILRIKRNGDVRTLKVKGSVITDENGKAQKVIGVDIDITNIQKAEDQLKESRHWLEQTARASPDSITIYDVGKKQPVYLNNRLAEWLGMTSNDLLEMGFEERLKLIYPDDRLDLLQNNEKTATAKDNITIGMEYRLKTNDGKTIWVRNRSKPFQRDESGNVTHILSILQNVTEEVQLREELKQRTQYAESIIDASIDRIAVYDKELRVIAWNRRSEEVTGRKKQNVLGQKLFDTFPKVEQDEELLKAHLDALEGSYVSLPAKRGIYTNNYYERFFIPLKNERKETYAIVSIMHDVSELVNRNAELNELNRSLEQKNEELEQKNEEITSFAFVASHDMKEPLRKIHTFSDWLVGQEAEQLSEKGKSMLEKMNTSVHRMEALIDDILVLTKIHSDTRREEEVNLNKVLRQVFDNMFEQILQTQTGVHANELPIIKGNSNQIFYLFQNLISNAIKFQKPGNVPHIKITAEIISGEEIGISNPYEEYAKVSFSDNGFGFDQRYAKKIFQVFQRLHGRHEFDGTGIGLAICKKIMENHEGMITVESEQGKGSVFSCYFPLF